MRIVGLSKEQLESIATSLDMHLQNYRERKSSSGKFKNLNIANFVIRPNYARLKDKQKTKHRFIRRGFPIRSWGNGRIISTENNKTISAVCYHGHGEFFIRAFNAGAILIDSCQYKFTSLEQLKKQLNDPIVENQAIQNSPCFCEVN